MSSSLQSEGNPSWGFRLSDGMFFRILILALFAYLLLEKDIRIDFNLSSLNAAAAGPAAEAPLHQSGFWPVARARDEAKPFPDPATRAIADRYNHLSFILSPDLAQRQRVPGSVVRYKRQLIDAYVHAYGDLAKRHREAYGIPASITMAQALLESNVGASDLARQSNNHFGIKCRRKCRGCTCRNYADDDAYDMFRVFSRPRESFEAHARLLRSPRYRHLSQIPIQDYRAWARGLKRAGYATDPHYAQKLVRLIEALDLHRLDTA